jgi:hypothetical protein
VTPERQNVWGGVQYRNTTNQEIFDLQAEPTAYTAFNNASWNQPTMLKGRASVSTTGSGNDLGLSVSNLPVGSYEIKVSGFLAAQVVGSTGTQRVRCSFRILESTTSTSVAQSTIQNWSNSGVSDTRDYPHAFHGVYNNTSLATRNFILQASKITDDTPSNNGRCLVNNSGLDMDVVITITPLDQPSNSALYVQGPVQAAATGAAIPEGYVNEFSTRSISDTTLRQQTSPAVNIFYYPWTSTLTLPAGNWMLCYKALIEVNQTVSSGNIAYVKMHIQNQTDSTEVMTNASLGQLLQTPYVLEYLWVPVSQCKPIAITSSKTFRMGIGYGNNTGIASVNALKIRGDINQTELYAIRLN